MQAAFGHEDESQLEGEDLADVEHLFPSDKTE